jgi:hypothetical protein
MGIAVASTHHELLALSSSSSITRGKSYALRRDWTESLRFKLLYSRTASQMSEIW